MQGIVTESAEAQIRNYVDSRAWGDYDALDTKLRV